MPATPVPSAVAKCTVTGVALASDSVTVKVSTPPSVAEALPIETVSTSRSSMIVPLPGVVPSVASVGADSATVKVPSGSLAILSSIF